MRYLTRLARKLFSVRNDTDLTTRQRQFQFVVSEISLTSNASPLPEELYVLLADAPVVLLPLDQDLEPVEVPNIRILNSKSLKVKLVG